MRRIVSLVTVAALMAASLAVGAGPAAAQELPPIDKDFCKASKAELKERGGNQGQCIKVVKSLSGT